VQTTEINADLLLKFRKLRLFPGFWRNTCGSLCFASQRALALVYGKATARQISLDQNACHGHETANNETAQWKRRNYEQPQISIPILANHANLCAAFSRTEGFVAWCKNYDRFVAGFVSTISEFSLWGTLL